MIDRTEQDIMKNWKDDVNTPLVSVCTITYNHEKFIAEALDSFLMQETDFPFELVIDDDCSPDDTSEVIKQYIKKFPSIIKANLREENIGMMPNFIANMKRAKGKYIALCEGDDYWTDPLKLKKQVDFLEGNEEYVATYHAVDHVYPDGQLKTTSYYHKDYSSDEMKLGIAEMQTSSVMYRNFGITFPDSFRESPVGDTITAHLAGFYGSSKFFKEITANKYRIHDGGVWSGIKSFYRAKKSIEVKKIIRENLVDDDLVLKMNKSIEERYLEFFFVFLRDGLFDAYTDLWKVVWKDNDSYTHTMILKHILDINRRAVHKLLRKYGREESKYVLENKQ